MTRQSTRHILMIEPVDAGYNPETAETNDYQLDVHEPAEIVAAKYLTEFRGFRDALVEAGVFVTTVQGPRTSPDALFPNWFSTHDDGLVIYPMLTPNRRAERLPALIQMLTDRYGMKADMTVHENGGRALESTGSLVLDRVNNIAYCGLSARTDEGLARDWCEKLGYELVVFNTQDHRGKPVYHTDLVIWIGTDIAGICPGAIDENDRERVLASLKKHREVVEFSNDQLQSFCGNALELRGTDDAFMFAVSQQAYDTLNAVQLAALQKYYTKIITAKIPTIETYGGGSARCMLQELF